jgi:hypothetical protein
MRSAQRMGGEFALCMRAPVAEHYPHAPRIRIVLDNLSTDTPAALYQAFPAAAARRILRRLEFHYTPKPASWLNMVEIEIGVIKGRCLDWRLSDPGVLKAEIATWRARATVRVRASLGCSRPKKPGPRWAALIPGQPLPMDPSNRHNLCEKVLADPRRRASGADGLRPPPCDRGARWRARAPA